MVVGKRRDEDEEKIGRRTYSVACGELLLSRDGAAGALRGVQRRVASHDGLALRCAATSLATNLGNRVPLVRHFDCDSLISSSDERIADSVKCGSHGCVGVGCLYVSCLWS